MFLLPVFAITRILFTDTFWAWWKELFMTRRPWTFTACAIPYFFPYKPKRHKERDCHRSDELMQGTCFFFTCIEMFIPTLFLRTTEKMMWS